MSVVQVPEPETKNETALLCTRCRDYLTVFPIMTFNRENICGRCYRLEEFTDDTRPFRNIPFETLSVMYAFPCKYRTRGCTERKRGNARLIHEQNCLHRLFKCFVPNCEWNEVVANLQFHVEQTHPDLFLHTGDFHINTDTDYELSTLILDKHVLYILQTKFDKLSGKCWLCVFHIKTTQHHKIDGLELEFKSDCSNLIFKTTFNDEFKPICIETALELDVFSLKSLLGNPEQLTGSLKLLMQNGEGLMDVDLLKVLECRVCRVYMVAPIFLCSNGHSICEYCSERVTSCPTCRDPLGNVRNYVLEDIVKVMYYPCKFNINNCMFIASSIEIRKHEEDCVFKI